MLRNFLSVNKIIFASRGYSKYAFVSLSKKFHADDKNGPYNLTWNNDTAIGVLYFLNVEWWKVRDRSLTVSRHSLKINDPMGKWTNTFKMFYSLFY